MIGTFPTVTVNFGSPNYTVTEGAGSVAVCLTTNGHNDEPLPVIVTASARTASCKNITRSTIMYVMLYYTALQFHAVKIII